VFLAADHHVLVAVAVHVARAVEGLAGVDECLSNVLAGRRVVVGRGSHGVECGGWGLLTLKLPSRPLSLAAAAAWSKIAS